jgi:hypothetical protein
VADLYIANHGSIVIVSGTSDAGRSWIEDKLINGNKAHLWAGGVVVESRGLEMIVAGAINDDLEVL